MSQNAMRTFSIPTLRNWQQAALTVYETKGAPDFLAVATPGAGKTTFALVVACRLMQAGIIEKVNIVCPTEHLKSQWADAAARFGLQLDPAFANAQRYPGKHFDGVAVTYAQVASAPELHAELNSLAPTLVILDEIHHAGDAKTWGQGIETACSVATRRLSLTGTPFRSDSSKIPFVAYERCADGIRRSRADYTYGYGQALKDQVVRPVMFLSYAGTMQWRTNQGDVISADLTDMLTRDLTAQAWRTALDPRGQWIKDVLAAADQRLTEVRRTMPDAGGLVIASNQDNARAYARLIGDIVGEDALVVLSDDAFASDNIEKFAAGTQRWIVAVRMVSEGVDVPRLAVGVYATSASTPLFFAQAVGRFVRARRRGETASVFLPNIQILLDHASRMEEERNHALKLPGQSEKDSFWLEEELLRQAQKEEKASDELTGKYEALDSDAEFNQVVFDGDLFGAGVFAPSVEEEEFLGIPGLLDPMQMKQLLRQREKSAAEERSRQMQAAKMRQENSKVSDHRARAAARKELSNLVAGWARRSGESHAYIHAQLREICGGPEVPQASTEEIQKRCQMLRQWFVGRR